MTKYVLNSGNLKKYPEKAKKFFTEVIKDLGDSPRVLFCFFAFGRGYWEEKFEKYKEGFIESINDKIKPVFELAFPDKFVEQIKNNDVVILYGGDDFLLQSYLKQFDLPKIWENKIVASISAGSDALVKQFWTCDWRECREGLGILPIKFIPHYESEYGSSGPRGLIDWKKAYNELAEYGDKTLPIHALLEGDFIVMKK